MAAKDYDHLFKLLIIGWFISLALTCDESQSTVLILTLSRI